MPLTDDDFERSQEPNMHSHDRTLLSKLGFADPDKRNPDHDLACLYLTQPDVARKVAAWMMDLRGEWTSETGKWRYSKVRLFATTQEHHLQKGSGQYATSIGFIDVVFDFEGIIQGTRTAEWSQIKNAFIPCEPVTKTSGIDRWTMLIEVKIAPVSIGDVLRQLNLYTTYHKASERVPGKLPRCLLVAPWEVSAAELDALRKSGYEFLKLGKAFNDWKQSLSKKGDTKEI